MTTHRLVYTAALTAFLLLSGCGGGGGGGGGNPPPPPPPTQYGTLAIDQNNVDVIGFSVVMAEAALSIAQTAANEVVVFSTSSGVAFRDCLHYGTASITHDDADASFSVSAGDSLTVVYDQCFGEAINGDVTGTFEIAITEFMSDSSSASLRAALDIPNAVEIINRADPSQVSELLASMDIEFSIDPSETLVVSSTATDEISITVQGTTESLSDFSLSRDTTAGSHGAQAHEVDMSITFDFLYDSGLLGGTATCETDPWFRFIQGNVGAANVLCRGRDSSGVSSSGTETISIDPDGDGVFAPYGTIAWHTVYDGYLREPSGLNLEDLFGQIATRSISLSTTDVFYDTGRDRLLVTTTETDAFAPSAVVAVSLSQGTQTILESFGTQPSALALSADGAALYVGFTGLDEIRKYDAATMQLLSTVNIVSNDPASTLYGVLDLAVSPVDPGIVAATFNYVGTAVDDVAMFANDVQLPGRLRNAPGGNTSAGEKLFFSADGSRIHSYYQPPPQNTGAFDMVVDATGVVEVFTNRRFGFDLELAEGRLFSHGYDYDAGTYVRLGSFGWGVRHIAVDTIGRRFYSESYDTLEVWDLDRRLPLATYELGFDDQSVNDIAMAGDHLVLVRDNDLRILDTAIVETMAAEECTVSQGQTLEGDGYTQFACNIIDAIYDPSADRIYAAVTNLVPGNGNSIAVIDPTGNVVENYVPVPSNPKQLMLSGDGTRLYVTFAEAELLVAVDTNSLAVAATWQLGSITPQNGFDELTPQIAMQMAASPLEPDTLVIYSKEVRFGTNKFVAFRNGNRLPDEIAVSALRSNTTFPYPRPLFDAAGSLYSLHANNTDPYVETLSLTATGLATTGVWFDAPDVDWWAPHQFSVAGPEVFFAYGDVVNIANQTTERRFDYNDVPFTDINVPVAVHADPASDDVWFVTQSSFNSTGFARFDNSDGTLSGADEFPLLVWGQNGGYSHASIFNVGADQLGLVISEREGVFVIDKAAIE